MANSCRLPTLARNRRCPRRRRKFRTWGLIGAEIMEGRSNYRGWENQFTKRFGNNWQLDASYTLSKFNDDGGIGRPAGPYITTLTPGADIPTQLTPLGIDVAADLRPDYGVADSNQTHRATVNGIWEIGKGLQLSGLYFCDRQRSRTMAAVGAAARRITGLLLTFAPR